MGPASFRLFGLDATAHSLIESDAYGPASGGLRTTSVAYSQVGNQLRGLGRSPAGPYVGISYGWQGNRLAFRLFTSGVTAAVATVTYDRIDPARFVRTSASIGTPVRSATERCARIAPLALP